MNVERHEPDTNSLAAYLDGRLEPAETQRVTEHLSRCAVCRETMALFARTIAAEPGLRRVKATSARAPSRSAKVLSFDAAREGWEAIRDRVWRAPRSAWLPLAAGLVIVAALSLNRLSLNRLSLNRLPGIDDVSRPSSPEVPVPADVVREQPGQPATDVKQPPLPAARDAAPPDRAVPQGRPAQDPIDERLLVTRGAERRVGDKTFRLVAGQWIDSSFDAAAALPLIEITTREEREALLSRLPALAPYAALGDRVLVVFDGTVYRFGRGDLP